MAIKNIIAQGIGFSPGSVKFIPTLGFAIGVTAFTITLPSATWDGFGQAPEVIVKEVGGSSNEVLVDGLNSQTIDGAANVSMTTAYGRLHVISDKVNWMRVD